MGKSSISPSIVLSYMASISHHHLYVFPSKARILLCAKEAIIRFPAIVLFTAKSLQVDIRYIHILWTPRNSDRISPRKPCSSCFFGLDQGSSCYSLFSSTSTSVSASGRFWVTCLTRCFQVSLLSINYYVLLSIYAMLWLAAGCRFSHSLLWRPPARI